MILDRRGPNAEEARLRRASQQLTPGWVLSDYVLDRDRVMKVYSTDLVEMFYAFEISLERGATNCIAASVEYSLLADMEAAREYCRRMGDPQPRGCVLMSLFTEPMGDGNAVDYAQEAHARVLEEADAWQAAHRICGREPLLRGPLLEMLTVDDHCGLVAVSREAVRAPDDPNWQAMEDIFCRSLAQYTAVPGLKANADKTIWAADHAVVLGASIDGQGGFVEAPPGRRGLLVLATLKALDVGQLKVAHARQLLGQWAHCCCFARSALALMQEVYQVVMRGSKESSVVQLLDEERDELLALSACAPLLFSQMRAEVVPSLLCSDASPSGGGLAEALVPGPIARELWRRRAVRGGHTRLATAYECYCLEKGLDEEGAKAAGLLEPLGSLTVYFDFLEICAGPRAPLSCSMRHGGLVVGPPVDPRRHSFWDLRDDRVFAWLVDIVRARRVFYLHLAPPCTTFSVARKPALRSRHCPFGYRAPEADHGNVLFLRCLTLLYLQHQARLHGSLEHPFSSLANHLPQVKGGLRTWLKRGVLSMCSHGMPWRKDTQLLFVGGEFLASLFLRCQGGHRHVRLMGQLTAAAAEYPRRLCELGSTLVVAERGTADFPRWDPPAPLALHVRWVNMILKGITFRVVRTCRWRARRHINLLELAMVKQGLEHSLAAHGVNHRMSMAVDSLVACGVGAKGRSASKALNREWRRTLGSQLLASVRLGLHYAPIMYNPADHPSCGKPIPPPASRTSPWWHCRRPGPSLDLLARTKYSRVVGLWVELIFRLGYKYRFLGGLMHFDPNGLEGDGPRAAPANRTTDLLALVTVTRPTALRRQKLLKAFHLWLQKRNLGLTQFWLLRVEVADALLAEYGQAVFESGRSLHDYSETINALVSGRPAWRRQTAMSWKLARAWRSLVPLQNHRPMPLPILLAMQSRALQRRAPRMCAALGLGFLGLLRPDELMRLKACSVMTPSKLMGPGFRLFVDIGAAESSTRGGALHQHVKVEDEVLVPFLDRVVSLMDPADKFVPGGPYAFRKFWDLLLYDVGVPTGAAQGLTPASLRAGGATYMFANGVALESIKWRGRWQSLQMLEHYLQEVASASIVPALSPRSRATVVAEASRARTFVAVFSALEVPRSQAQKRLSSAP